MQRGVSALFKKAVRAIKPNSHLAGCAHAVPTLGQCFGTVSDAATGTSYRCLKNLPYILWRLSWSSLMADHFLKVQMPASVWYHMGISGPRRGTT